jgi:hypothetical protein
MVERWPQARLSFKQALADVRKEEVDASFGFTRADELLLAQRRHARKAKQYEQWMQEMEVQNRGEV